MAQSSSCFNEIVDNDGLTLLINFLNITPNAKLTEAELAACERVHQKSAIALTRLAKDPDNAARVVHKGGQCPPSFVREISSQCVCVSGESQCLKEPLIYRACETT